MLPTLLVAIRFEPQPYCNLNQLSFVLGFDAVDWVYGWCPISGFDFDCSVDRDYVGSASRVCLFPLNQPVASYHFTLLSIVHRGVVSLILKGLRYSRFLPMEVDASDPEVTLQFYKRLYPFRQLFTWLNQGHSEPMHTYWSRSWLTRR